MQISDLTRQYQQAISSGAETLTGTKGVENLVASLRSLTKGNIFEGMVSSVKNGMVTLLLSGGQQVTARMDGKIDLSVGESMFFQVKSNDGRQIAIRPFSIDGNGSNYTLMKALSEAGLPAQPDYLSMVNRMMEEQMPIDRSSLQQMARLVNANPRINVQTLVQLKKLDIPITVENASQFENYMDDSQAITKEVDHFLEQLPTALKTMGEENPDAFMQVRQLGSEILGVLTEGLKEVPEPPETAPFKMNMMENPGRESIQEETVFTQNETENPVSPDSLQQNLAEVPEKNSLPSDAEQIPEENFLSSDARQVQGENQSTQFPHTLGALFSKEQLQHINHMIGQILGRDAVSYTKDSGVVEVLKDLRQVLKDPLPVEREKLYRLFSSKEFHSMIRDTAEQQWMLEPKSLADKVPVERLYERLNSQMGRIENALRAAGQENAGISQIAGEIRNNVEFMNQVNQVYTYVQIPLKMSGQHASGELFVYTNKKALLQTDKELTAFLHLDLDHLGATDVSVRMKGHEVGVNFYLDNEDSYALLEKNYPVLEAVLKRKGYNSKITVTNEEKHVNFVEDFLKKDQPSAGQLHRYSFDMRA